MSNKIDAMVAEKVMMWYRCTEGCSKCGDPTRCFFVDSDGSVWKHGGIVPFSPSTNISAALDVVEEWGVLPWNIDNGWREKDGERISGVTCKVTTHTGSFEATEKDMPMAVCVCALRAVGVDEATIQEAMK